MVESWHPAHSRRRSAAGFTLIELVVVVIIVGVLAAIAVPRYVALGQQARIAAVRTMAATLQSTALNVRALCLLSPDCDYANVGQHVVIAGRSADVNYGWLGVGNPDSIESWINVAGFSVVPNNGSYAMFTLDGSPAPGTCSVSYYHAYARGSALGILITTATSGC